MTVAADSTLAALCKNTPRIYTLVFIAFSQASVGYGIWVMSDDRSVDDVEYLYDSETLVFCSSEFLVNNPLIDLVNPFNAKCAIFRFSHLPFRNDKHIMIHILKINVSFVILQINMYKYVSNIFVKQQHLHLYPSIIQIIRAPT